MMKQRYFTCLCVAICAATCHGGNRHDTTAFAFRRSLYPPPAVTAPVATIALDADMFAVTQDDLRDIRLIDPHGAEQAYLLKRAVAVHAHTERVPHPHRVVSVEETQDNTLVIVIEMTDRRVEIDGMTLHTPLKNFERALDVSYGNDGRNWAPLITGSVIYDYTRFMDVHNRDILFPTPTRARYYRIVIHNVTDEYATSLQHITRSAEDSAAWTQERKDIARQPLRIDRIDVWRNVRVPARTREETSAYAPVEWKTYTDTTQRVTYVDIMARRIPVSRIELHSSDNNFSRRVDIGALNDDGPMTILARGRITRIHLGAVRQEQMTLSIPEGRRMRYRLVIPHEDNPPITITDVRLHGPLYRLHWLPQTATDVYTLVYGNASARQPHYDVAALTATAEKEELHTLWRAGTSERNPAFTGVFDQTSRTPAWVMRYALPSALILMMCALAYAIWHAGRAISAQTDSGTGRT